jgi:hypothetical protein
MVEIVQRQYEEDGVMSETVDRAWSPDEWHRAFRQEKAELCLYMGGPSERRYGSGIEIVFYPLERRETWGKGEGGYAERREEREYCRNNPYEDFRIEYATSDRGERDTFYVARTVGYRRYVVDAPDKAREMYLLLERINRGMKRLSDAEGWMTGGIAGQAESLRRLCRVLGIKKICRTTESAGMYSRIDTDTVEYFTPLEASERLRTALETFFPQEVREKVHSL